MDINHFPESVLISMITTFVAAWLTASFALRRFSKETIWKRKAAAYTEARMPSTKRISAIMPPG